MSVVSSLASLAVEMALVELTVVTMPDGSLVLLWRDREMGRLAAQAWRGP